MIWSDAQAAAQFRAELEAPPISPDRLAFESRFSGLAADPARFDALLTTVFGGDHDRETAEILRQQALSGDYTWLPDVRYVDAATLSGGRAAYDAASETIFIDVELRGTALGARYFAEEVGHHLDTRLNDADSVGDEGELFERHLSGDAPDADESRHLREENDHGTLVIDGESREVEFGGWRWFEEKVTKPVKEVFIEPAGDLLESGRDSLLDWSKDSWNGIRDILDGHVSRGAEDYLDAQRELVRDTGGLVVDAAALATHSLAEVVDGVFGLGDERGLNQAEIDYLRPVFGDSIDYGDIRIQRGGTYASLTNASEGRTIRNEIFLPNTKGDGEPLFAADGTLTDAGYKLLGHEAAHVWQYERDGIDYINGSVGEQINGDLFGGQDAYDWERAVTELIPFDEMGVEQQAALAEEIAVAIDRNVDAGFGPILTQTDFFVNRRQPDTNEWMIITDALDTLRG